MVFKWLKKITSNSSDSQDKENATPGLPDPDTGKRKHCTSTGSEQASPEKAEKAPEAKKIKSSFTEKFGQKNQSLQNVSSLYKKNHNSEYNLNRLPKPSINRAQSVKHTGLTSSRPSKIDKNELDNWYRSLKELNDTKRKRHGSEKIPRKALPVSPRNSHMLVNRVGSPYSTGCVRLL